MASPEQTWRILDRENRAGVIKWTRTWMAYYMTQGQKIAKQISTPNPYANTFVKEDIEALFLDMYKDVGTRWAEIGFKMVIEQKSIGYDEATIRAWETSMMQYAVTYGASSIVSIQNTGLSSAQRIISKLTEQAIAEAVSPDDLALWIERAIPVEWRILSKFNAERIARTEVLSASAHGNHIGAASTGVALNKVWITAMDGRERAEHAAVNGTKVPMNEKFQVGSDAMLHPRHKGASAGNVINCRCQVGYESILKL